eukprot:14943113-Heterocapsa_arctica.AAC.1
MECIMKTQVMKGNFTTSYKVFTGVMKMNPNRSIMSELRKKIVADKSDKNMKNLIWLLFVISLLTTGLNHDELMYLVGRIRHTIKLGLSTSVNKDGLGDDCDLPLPKKDKDAFEVSKMKAVE